MSYISQLEKQCVSKKSELDKLNIEKLPLIKSYENRRNVISLAAEKEITDLNKEREGGLSGSPIKDLSDKVLKFLYREANQELILIGVGGVGSALDVYNKIKLGASLVQIYTSLTYGGPQLINKILIDLVKLIREDGFSNISEAVGVNNK